MNTLCCQCLRTKQPIQHLLMRHWLLAALSLPKHDQKLSCFIWRQHLSSRKTWRVFSADNLKVPPPPPLSFLKRRETVQTFHVEEQNPGRVPLRPSTRTQGPAGSRPVFSCERTLRENYFKVFFSYSTQTKSSKHYLYLALYRWLAASLASLLEQDGRHPCHNTGCSSVKLQ